MPKTRTLLLPSLVLLMTPLAGADAQERERSKVPAAYTWNIADIYPNDEAWTSEKEKFVGAIPEIERFKGRLAESPATLLQCLELRAQLSKQYGRLYTYASLSSDTDTRVAKTMEMKESISQVGSVLAAKSSFIEPEILKMDRAKVDSFLAQEKGLAIHKHDLDDVLRMQKHYGTEGEEAIIAHAGLMAPGPSNFYEVLADADFPFPEVTLSGGRKVKLDQAAFALERTASNREDRKLVFTTFFGKLHEFRRTFGSSLNSEMLAHLFYARARKYDTTLESALDANAIPTAVYRSLVDNVNTALPTFHRYLALRKRMLKVSELHYYDLYAPLVKNLDKNYTVDEAKGHVIAALKPLGTEYQATLQKAYDDRWLDFYPTAGKRSGAYSNGGAYDVHPYMLLNYNGKYDDVSTLAHELGHTMQSYLSNKKQPYVTARYPIFVAEVASTFNEALLIQHMLGQDMDDQARLSLLGNYLEGIKGTVFRQTQFAEFELAIHEKVEKGEALTGDALDALYLGIARKYYGHDKGVCIVDDEIKSEWSYIPHFYYNFYVYQYATSFLASAALSEKVMAGDAEATKRYLTFLSAGGSDYPIDLLKAAGVDMTTKEPFDLTMRKMNRVMDDIDKLLDKMATK